MTVSEHDPRLQYSGPGSGPFTTPIFDLEADLTVIKTDANGADTTLTLTTDYTLAGVGGNGVADNLTLVSALVSGETLTIIDDPAVTQTADYTANDPFPAATHERALDRMALILTRFKDLIDRCFQLPDSAADPSSPITLDLANNLSKPVYSNATGDGLTFGATLSGITVTGTQAAGKAPVADDATSVSWQTVLTDMVDDTTPQLGGMLDVNGQSLGDGTRELLTFVEDASAVNHIEVENEATGAGPIIRAAGDDTNIDLNLTPKGSGSVRINGPAEIDLGSDATGDIYYRNASGLFTRLAVGSNDQVLTLASGLPSWADASSGSWTIETAAATTSGSSVAYTGITAGVTEIEVQFDGVSTSSTGDILVQLGDSGGLETSGYVSSSQDGTSNISTSTSGFVVRASVASQAFTGFMRIVKFTGNKWLAMETATTSTYGHFSAGDKTLSAELDRLSIVTTTGTFDAGEVNIRYK